MLSAPDKSHLFISLIKIIRKKIYFGDPLKYPPIQSLHCRELFVFLEEPR